MDGRARDVGRAKTRGAISLTQPVPAVVRCPAVRWSAAVARTRVAHGSPSRSVRRGGTLSQRVDRHEWLPRWGAIRLLLALSCRASLGSSQPCHDDHGGSRASRDAQHRGTRSRSSR
ncbi:hypothetical protein ACFPRL_08285 [Pseudoclavibacter helvolus]